MKGKRCCRAIVALGALTFLSAILTSAPASTCWGADPVEGTLGASELVQGAAVLEWRADADRVLSGYYIRLANPVPPQETPIVAALEVRGERVAASAAIPAFPRPLFDHTQPYFRAESTFPPLDVGREFRRAIEPIAISKGDLVRVTIDSCAEGGRSGVVCGLQFQGRYELANARAPFRECRTNGPICSIPWSEPEIVAVGTQEKFDPLCAPQNNASVIDDEDGTLYAFCAYYSVDEQYGGGRGGSYSRIYGYRKAPGAEKWEFMGLIVDVMEGETYSGDPFVFRDLEGRPTLVFTTCDGTEGFLDWSLGGAYLMRSETDSFAGPWSKPWPLWDKYPREPDDNKTGGRANCLRIYPRRKTNDYLVVWNHGARDMDIRALVLPDLETLVSHDAIGSAPIFVRNQEEGGGGFTNGDKGYYSTWQIPGLNDPNGQQRLYEIDLTDPLAPESWRVVPGSIGFNDGSNTRRDGGATADAWAISVAGGRVWATSCEYSQTENRNYLYARSAPLEAFDEYVAGGKGDGVFRYGTVLHEWYRETFPTVEYAVGRNCSFETDFESFGSESYAFLSFGPSDARGAARTLYFEVNPEGALFVSYDEERNRAELAKSDAATWAPGKKMRLKLTRRGDVYTGCVDGKEILSVTIDDPELKKALDDDPRFRLYGWRGGRYTISNAVLTDGEE